MIEKTCIKCNKKFIVDNNRNNAKFCNINCRKSYKIINIYKCDNPHKNPKCKIWLSSKRYKLCNSCCQFVKFPINCGLEKIKNEIFYFRICYQCTEKIYHLDKPDMLMQNRKKCKCLK